MKILLVSQEYPPQTARGGIGTQTHIKAHGLSGLGHEVVVLSRSVDERPQEYMEDGIRVVRIPGLETFLPDMTEPVQWLTHSVAVAAKIEQLRAETAFDIIDFPEWAAEGYVHLLNRTSWNHIPVVIQLHGPLVMFARTVGWPDVNSPFYRAGIHMEAMCVQLADSVYSSSACSAQWCLEHYHPQNPNITTLHMGVDTAVFAPQPVAKHARPTVLFVGKLVQNKGVEQLLAAAAILLKEFPGLKLRLIGTAEPPVVQQLKENAVQLGLSYALYVPGFVPKEKLPQEFSQAHIFAAPSFYEGGPGFVYLEAMACGLPVVGCSGSGLDEIIRPGENGVLVEPKNSSALALALRELLHDRQKCRSMGLRAREYVLSHADSRVCVQRLEDFYKRTAP